MRTPPHLVCWEGGVPSLPGDNPAELFDYRLLMSAPVEARQLFLEKRLSDPSSGDACAWLDLESRKCRFHEFRPEICRTFEMNGGACRLLHTAMLG